MTINTTFPQITKHDMHLINTFLDKYEAYLEMHDYSLSHISDKSMQMRENIFHEIERTPNFNVQDILTKMSYPAVEVNEEDEVIFEVKLPSIIALMLFKNKTPIYNEIKQISKKRNIKNTLVIPTYNVENAQKFVHNKYVGEYRVLKLLSIFVTFLLVYFNFVAWLNGIDGAVALIISIFVFIFLFILKLIIDSFKFQLEKKLGKLMLLNGITVPMYELLKYNSIVYELTLHGVLEIKEALINE